MSQLASNLYFVGSNVGAPGASSVSYQAPPTADTGSGLESLANQQHLGAMNQPREEKKQGSSNNFNQNQFRQAPTSTGPTASAPTGSNLVAGGPGTGMAASYAGNMGLGGAVSAGGLGSYGGATGLMSGTAAGSGAGWAGLGSASAGMTYGGATGAATASGASMSGMGLGGASAGMTYGGGAAAGGAAGGGAASGMGGALMSNPWTAIAAAIIGGANYLDNKDISSWGDTLKGKAGGNMLDYYGGRKDGKTHGLLGKVFDKDGSTGQQSKAITDLSEGDFGNALSNQKDAIKSLFKGKLW